jgi:hypothetical protein
MWRNKELVGSTLGSLILGPYNDAWIAIFQKMYKFGTVGYLLGNLRHEGCVTKKKIRNPDPYHKANTQCVILVPMYRALIRR